MIHFRKQAFAKSPSQLPAEEQGKYPDTESLSSQHRRQQVQKKPKRHTKTRSIPSACSLETNLAPCPTDSTDCRIYIFDFACCRICAIIYHCFKAGPVQAKSAPSHWRGSGAPWRLGLARADRAVQAEGRNPGPRVNSLTNFAQARPKD